MKTLLNLFLVLFFSLKTFSQVKISEILAYGYNNNKNIFTKNVVGKESIDVDAYSYNTLIIIKLNRLHEKEYKYLKRKLKIIVKYVGEEREEIFEEQEVVIPFVSSTFYVPFITQQGTTDITIIAELYEEEKLVSTKKQFLVTWSGD